MDEAHRLCGGRALRGDQALQGARHVARGGEGAGMGGRPRQRRSARLGLPDRLPVPGGGRERHGLGRVERPEPRAADAAAGAAETPDADPPPGDAPYGGDPMAASALVRRARRLLQVPVDHRAGLPARGRGEPRRVRARGRAAERVAVHDLGLGSRPHLHLPGQGPEQVRPGHLEQQQHPHQDRRRARAWQGAELERPQRVQVLHHAAVVARLAEWPRGDATRPALRHDARPRRRTGDRASCGAKE
mmetsp:Transcript_75658/g.231601  ORF Transcript_75658/g.231601 Transcript_75658/m.231601 type:complete len:246 (+) Transcript_75658:211-948(+)